MTKMATGARKQEALTLCLCRKKGITTEMYLSTVRATVVYTDPINAIWVNPKYGANRG